MEIIPAVDVLGGRVVRLLRGEFGTAREYGDDPVATAASWVQQGARLVHVVDLDGARRGKVDPTLAERLGRSAVPFQIGGGIRTAADARAAVRAGAHRVVVGTAAVWDPPLLAAMVEALGADRVVAALDVRDRRATGEGWRDPGKNLDEVLAGVAASGVQWVLVTSIERDGALTGPDIELVRRVREGAPVRVIGSGGVASPEDLRALAGAGAAAVVVGRALYERRFTLAEAREVAGDRGRDRG